jgi:F-type H+-transporting ATPase subunit gamma
MAGLKQIKGKIKATDRTRKVTKAMEAVSAVKMRKSQERALSGRPYAHAALSILSRVAPSLLATRHPLTETRPGMRTLVVLITSDKGLAGNLNNAVLKEAVRVIANVPKNDTSFMCLGKRGYEFFEKRGYRILSHRMNVRDDVSIEDLAELSNEAVRHFLANECDRVVVVHQNFKSTFEQQPRASTILPLDAAALTETVSGIVPKTGRFSSVSDAPAPAAYTVEPSEEAVLGELLPRLSRVMLYHAMMEGKASEHSARMVAMKNASDKAKDVSKALNLVYNKARQAAITREVSEITGGIEAMSASQ